MTTTPTDARNALAELLPCPFCGGKAERPTPDAPHGGMVQCSSCGASAFGPKWNRRTANARIAALEAQVEGMRWLPIDCADKTITDVQDFSEVGITLRNSDRYWVRDEDGRVYEASWTDDKAGYWWDWEGESQVDPVEFMPHPLDPRFRAALQSSETTGEK